MNTILIVARAGLAAVFLVAAIAKLADMAGSRDALKGFGVPPAIVPAAGVVLPALELTSAILMAVSSTARFGAILALALLLMFIGGIAAALRRGRAPDCHCFGQLHSKPAGAETINRNGILAAVALFVAIAGPGPGLGTWLSHSSGVTVALAGSALASVVLAYACFSLWRDNRELRGIGRTSELPTQLEVNQLMPEFEATDEAGGRVPSAELLHEGRAAVFVFTSSGCGPCLGLLPELARWREMLIGRLDIHVLASGDAEVNGRLATEHGIQLLSDQDGTVANAFGILGTPSAVEIDATGRVAAPAAIGATAIEGLIRASLKRPTAASGIDVVHANGTAQPSRAEAAS